MSFVKHLLELNTRMMKACDQVTYLEQNIADLVVRHDRAVKVEQKSHCYQLRLRLASLQGVQGAYMHYADKKVEETLQLEAKINMETVKKHIEAEVEKSKQLERPISHVINQEYVRSCRQPATVEDDLHLFTCMQRQNNK